MNILKKTVESSGGEKDIIIFDIDGTLSNPKDRVHYISGDNKDWDSFYSECGNDHPFKSTCWIAQSMERQYPYITTLFITGRKESCRNATLSWLRKYVSIDICNPQLIMRKEEDHREDYVIKKEFVINNNLTERIFAVFEDRLSVVSMWRKLGIQTYHVGGGDF